MQPHSAASGPSSPWETQPLSLPNNARLADNNSNSSGSSSNSVSDQQRQQASSFDDQRQSFVPGYFGTASLGTGPRPVRSDPASASSSSHGHGSRQGDSPIASGSASGSGSGSRPRIISDEITAGTPDGRSSLYMGPASNTVGLASTSSAIARGEIGQTYSRYSLSSPPSSDYRRPQSQYSSPFGVNLMHTPMSASGEDIATPLDQLPVAGYTSGQFPEHGLDSPIIRHSQYSLNTDPRRDSSYLDGASSPTLYTDHKYMEDAALLWNVKNVEQDDFLHDPRTLENGNSDRFWHFPASGRGLVNAAGIMVLVGGIIALFLGWPVHTYLFNDVPMASFGFSLGGINASGQVPDIPGLPSLIDQDTPDDIKNAVRTGFNGRKYQLAFSDEFNREGRTFFPGDDPFWEAVDLNYWQTRDLEWYDPDAATTKNGKLEITLSEQPIHNLNFRSAMLQSWNKLCFNGGMYVEVAMSLPGDTIASGFWPGAWSMGNLGRAGYGATNDGMWPYSYNECDVGTLPGQMFANNTPIAAYNGSGQPDYRGRLSILSGQRASACTCPGQDHPGPSNNVGRGAPEIDIIEAQVDWRGYGTASQSIQLAPFDYQWIWDNTSANGMVIYNKTSTYLNEWKGAATQESCSAVTNIGTTAYNGVAYQSYGYEYVPGATTDSQITWAVNGKPTWTLKAGAFKPDSRTGVGQRPIAEEPMYLILNLGMSPAFQTLQFNKLKFPGVLRIDYVRVWQEQGKVDVSCDPASHPTANYINKHMDLYTNPNITTWPKNIWPKNSLTGC